MSWNATPLPSRLVKLEQLHEQDAGLKVRFLGCVHAYDADNTHLILRDRFPATAKSAPTALVDIAGILEGLKHDLCVTGTWINVIGYIRPRPEGIKLSRKARVTFVEASMIWSAGIIRLDKYQGAVEARQATMEAP